MRGLSDEMLLEARAVTRQTPIKIRFDLSFPRIEDQVRSGTMEERIPFLSGRDGDQLAFSSCRKQVTPSRFLCSEFPAFGIYFTALTALQIDGSRRFEGTHNCIMMPVCSLLRSRPASQAEQDRFAFEPPVE